MLRSLAFRAALAVLPLSTYGQTVQLTLEPAPTKPVTISRHIYGHFAEHLGRCIYDGIWADEGLNVPKKDRYRLDVVQALQKIQVPNLRWPGGCFADVYHWRDGIGPRKDRPNTVNPFWGLKDPEDNSFGTHEFLELCRMLNAEPYLAGNMGSGTVQEMREWVEYLNAPQDLTPLAKERAKNGHADPYNVALFGVGNESWGCGGEMTSEYYADQYKQYGSFLKSYPNARLKKIASGSHDNDFAWTETILRKVPASQLWGISLHYYTLPTGVWEKKGSATTFNEQEYHTSMRMALAMDTILRGHEKAMDKYDPEKKVALVVDEWGVWADPLPGEPKGVLYQQNTLRDALVAGATLNIFNQHADRVRVANLAQAVNVLQALILTEKEKMVLTPTYHVFDLYKVHQDAQFVPLTFKSPDYVVAGKSLPALSASASKDKNGAVHISLVNLDTKKKLHLEADLNGLTVKTVDGQILTSPSVSDLNSFEAPDKVKLARFTGAKKQGNKLVIDLPPQSVVVLELK